jgi:hypothetical protein
MVFLSKILEPIEAPPNPPTIPPEKTPQYVSQHHFVGLITQLGAMTAYANDIFTELMDLAGSTYNRIAQLSARANNIAQSQANYEAFLKSTTVEQLLSNPRGAFSAATADSQQFTKATQSKSLKAIYDRASLPPNFSLVNPFTENGQDAYKQYSNPNFFLDEWIQEQSRLREEAKKARRERRRQRAERRQDDKTNPEQVVEVAKMKVVKYDPLTGEKIIVEAPSRSVQRATSAMTLTPNRLSTVVSLDDAPPPSAQQYQQQHTGIPYPNQPPTTQMYSSAPSAPSFMQDAPAPPISYATIRGTQHQQAPVAPQYQQYAQQSWNAPPPPTTPMYSSAPSAPAAPPPPAPAPPPPPPDAPPAPSGLLSALSQTKLKTATLDSKAKPADSRSGLMESIRSGIELKSTKDRAVPEKTVTKEETTVASILSRRIAFAGSSSSDEDSEDDGEWD